jgi:predicted DCC family thiol-disulfide oxidoreductase YuxK
LEILKDIGGVWRLLYLFKIVPVSIRDYVYRLIAANRYRFRK